MHHSSKVDQRKREEMAIAAKLTAERGKLPEAVNAAQQAAVLLQRRESRFKVAEEKDEKRL